MATPEETVLREVVREDSLASFQRGSEFDAVTIRHTRRELWANNIIEGALADGLVLVGATFDVDERVNLQFGEPPEAPSDPTVPRIVEDITEEFDAVEAGSDDGELSIVDGETETFDVTDVIEAVTAAGGVVSGLSAYAYQTVTGVTLRIRSSETPVDPYQMAGINEKERLGVHRHEALTLLRALDNFDCNRNTGRLRSQLLSECNLRRYAQYTPDVDVSE